MMQTAKRSSTTMRVLAVTTAFLCVFVFLASTLLSRDPPDISESDQVFYHSIAFDLHSHGVFTNGVWGPAGSEQQPPPAGMMYMPLYPALVWFAMQIDERFARAITCVNRARQQPSPRQQCAAYTRPMMVIHAILLSVGVVAVALAGQLIVSVPWIFPVTTVVAAIGVFSHAGLFSFMMTEALTFCLYSVVMLAFIACIKHPRTILFASSGVGLALLVLVRPSFIVLSALLPALLILRHWSRRTAGSLLRKAVVFLICFEAVLLPWQIRNYSSVGKFGLSEEYGAFNIIVRFGYNQMTLAGGLIAFPAALPQIGLPLTRALFGAEAPRQLGWGWEGSSLYGAGSGKVFELRSKYGRLDPIILGVIADELRENWWKYLLTTIPIAWTGLWIGQTWGLFLIPIFALALVHQVRRHEYLLLYYSAPALAMILAHAAFANPAPRFNIGFIAPVSIGGAVFLLQVALKRLAVLRNR
jgi:hypothetical protein